MPGIAPKSTGKPRARTTENSINIRHKVENMLRRLKDWRRIAMRYPRCAHTFFSAIFIAAIIIFYLN
jgi:transposase